MVEEFGTSNEQLASILRPLSSMSGYIFVRRPANWFRRVGLLLLLVQPENSTIEIGITRRWLIKWLSCWISNTRNTHF